MHRPAARKLADCHWQYIVERSARTGTRVSKSVCPSAGELQATIEIAVKGLPAVRVAYATLSVRQSIYPGALKASSAVREWITENEHAVDGDVRETYLNFNASIFSPSASMDDRCVEIAWPPSHQITRLTLPTDACTESADRHNSRLGST